DEGGLLTVILERMHLEVDRGHEGIRVPTYEGPVDLEVRESFIQVIGGGSGGPACIRVDGSNTQTRLVATDNIFRFSRASGVTVDAGLGAHMEARVERNFFEGFVSEMGDGRTGLGVGASNTDGEITTSVTATNNLMVDVSSGLDVNGQAQSEHTVHFNNNTVVRSSYRGVSVAAFGESVSQVAMVNNIIVDSGYHPVGTYEGSSATTVVVRHNNLYSGYGDEDSEESFEEDFVVGPDELEADPLFVDPDGSDFRLQRASPAIEVGAAQPEGGTGEGFDLDGADRKQDAEGDGTAQVDMGAYEAPALIDIFFESGTYPRENLGSGTSVSELFSIGHRFELSSRHELHAAGGYFRSHYAEGEFGEVFVAIVKLTGPEDFPDELDLSGSDVLDVQLMTIGPEEGDHLTEFDLVLSAGWYMLVMGSGAFGAGESEGAVAGGSMPYGFVDADLAQPAYAFRVPSESTFERAEVPRLLVAVPEPGKAVTALAALLSLAALARRGRRLRSR
ncbi:MAG: hypothetical protein JRH19_27615, partial [Deltaproteobacteria bacterium]|nr:hypothetical protein [Deltaproteobacteria bacterium]